MADTADRPTWVRHSMKNPHASSSSGGNCATCRGLPAPKTDVSQTNSIVVYANIVSSEVQREPSVSSSEGRPSRRVSVEFVVLGKIYLLINGHWAVPAPG
jgi:hypothetical protein